MSFTPSRLRCALQLALIALTGLMAYSNSFDVPFFFDDETSIFNNFVIKDLDRFLSAEGYSYNPRRFVGYLTFAFNYAAGGADVFGYHVVNLAIHTLSAFMVYWLVRLTLKTPHLAVPETESAPSRAADFIPLAAALLFIAHPVQTQAVTYIVQRLTSLCTLFYLLSLVCYAKARLLQEERGSAAAPASVAFYLASFIAAGCAMKTKEIAFTLPFAVVLYEFIFFKVTARKKLFLLTPVALTALVVPLSVIGVNRPLGQLLADLSAATRVDTQIPRLDYLLTQFPVQVTYLRLLLLPVNQNLDYDFPIYRSLTSPAVFLSLLLLAALVVLALVLLKRSGSNPRLRLVSFGILWFFLTLSVESSVIPIVDVIFEHRVYLPSVGAFIALAAVASETAKRLRPWQVNSGLALVVFVLAGATYARNEVWSSELTLWGDVVAKSPGKARPHHNLALAFFSDKRYGEALVHVTKAVQLDPAAPYPRNLMGSILGLKGNYFGAMSAFNEAIRLDPELAVPRINLADTYRARGYTQKALEQYEMALKLSPTNAEIYYKIGLAHVQTNDLEKAGMFFKSAARLDPSRAEYQRDYLRTLAPPR